MMRLRLWPFVWGIGIGVGAVLAVALGPYGPTWGAAVAFPAVALLFSVGAQFEHDGEEITHLLRFTIAFSIGFLWATIPINLLHLMFAVSRAEPELAPEIARRATELRAELWPRWGVLALAAPLGIAALFVRQRRVKLRASA
jgi:hypothetical protein